MNDKKIAAGGVNAIRQCRDGLMCYNPNDIYIGGALHKYGEFSHLEMSECFEVFIRPEDVVVEVGANIGSHTVGISKLARRVYAFEPQRLVFYLLCANLALNSITNVWAKNIGLGARRGVMQVAAPDPEQPCNVGGLSLYPLGADMGMPSEQVGVYTLDELGIGRVDFLKIDVEGMEREVLAGAEQTIARDQPLLYVENDRVEKSEALVAWLKEHGYALIWHQPMLYNPDNYAGDAENIYQNIASFNLLCFPATERGREAMKKLEGLGL